MFSSAFFVFIGPPPMMFKNFCGTSMLCVLVFSCCVIYFTSLCPSVETAVMLVLDILKRTPFSVGFSSSLEQAYVVFCIASFKKPVDICVMFSFIFLSSGNSSVLLHIKTYFPVSVFILILCVSFTLIETTFSFIVFAISKSL